MTLIRLSSLSDMVTNILISPWPEDWILYARKSYITKWVKSDIRILQSQYLSGLFLKVRFLAKLKCPHVCYVSAFAKDFLASCLELLQSFQHIVLVQASL